MGIRTKLAIAVTAVYVFGFVCLLVLRWQELAGLPLNELGDFLAGSFGPLALAWLVFGYFQQGDELRQGTEALRLQAQELRNSVDQQTELVKASNVSLENHELGLEPLLQITGYDSSSGLFENRRVAIDTLTFTNSGGYCESVAISAFVGDDLVGTVNCGALAKGSSYPVGFRDIFSDEIYYELRVTYRKSNKKSGEQVFKIKKIFNEDRYTISQEKIYA